MISVRNSANLQSIISTSGTKTTLLAFKAVWCKPCQQIKPFLEELAAKYARQMVFLELDVDAVPDLVSHFNVKSMPTFVFIRQNIVIKIIVGSNADLLASTCELISNATFPELI